MTDPQYAEDEAAMQSSHLHPAITGALWTVLALFGGLLFGVLLGNLAFSVLPGHSNDPLRIILAALPALAGMMFGSAVWGIQIGRLAHTSETRRMAWAGVLGFVPITLVLGIGLQLLEPIAIQRFGEQIPLHRLFTLLFVPTALLIAGTGSLALGVGLRNRQLAWTLAWRVGLVAALVFLVINLFMEALGWQVGGLRAAERLTMLTVMFVSDLGSALAGGAVLGLTLAPRRGSITRPSPAQRRRKKTAPDQ